jgi:hypothetical protein
MFIKSVTTTIAALILILGPVKTAKAQPLMDVGISLGMPARDALQNLDWMVAEAYQNVTGEKPAPAEPRKTAYHDDVAECFDLRKAGRSRNSEIICVGAKANHIIWVEREVQGDSGSVDDVIGGLLANFGQSPQLLRISSGKKPVKSLSPFHGINKAVLAEKAVDLFWALDARDQPLSLPKSCLPTLGGLSFTYWISSKSPEASGDRGCPKMSTVTYATVAWNNPTNVYVVVTASYKRPPS